MFRSLKKQLITFSVGFLLVAAGLITFLSCNFIYRNTVSLSMNYNKQVIHQLCNNIDFFLGDVSAKITSLSYTSEMRFYGSNFIVTGITPSKSAVKRILWDAVSASNSLDDISLIYDNKKTLSLFNMYDEKTLLEVCRYYKENISSYDAAFVPIIHSNNNGVPALSCVKYITNSSKAGGYYIVGSIVIDEIFDLLNDVDLGEDSGLCLVDVKGSIQYATLSDTLFAEDMVELMTKKDFSQSMNFITALGGEQYMLSVYPLSNSNLSTVVYIPLANITKTTISLLCMMIGIILIFLFIAVCVSIRLSIRLTLPITELADYARNWQGYNMPVLKTKGSEETDILYYAFQEMNKRIQLLVKKNIQDQEEKRKAEILALQAQINPHFLYNTLDSINALAILNDSQEISDMTTALARLFRLSIGRPDEFITIEKEIEYVKAYLVIQKIRYNDKFDVEFDIDNSVCDFSIIRLIIQPLIENCIYHGFEGKEDKGHIIIKIWGEKKNIIIRIVDNGIGVDPETEKKIQMQLQAIKNPIAGDSVGIYNVNKRLNLYYGNKASFVFQSVQNEQTVITISIPKEKEKKNV